MNQVAVTSAIKLDADQRAAVKTLVEKKLGQSEFALQEIVDSSVLGGLRVQINSRVYDATVQGKLKALQEASR